MPLDVSTGFLYEVDQRVKSAPWGQAERVWSECARLAGTTVPTLRRWVRDEFGRKKACPGRGKTYSDELIRMVWDVKLSAMDMGTHRREPATAWALGYLADRGFEEAASASVSAVNTRIKPLRAKRFFDRIEPDYACQVVHMDFSRSKYTQIHTFDPVLNDYVLRVDGRGLAYKEDNTARRSWLVSYMDGYSRLFHARMYAASGEDATLAMQHLKHVYLGEHEHPLIHLPTQLWMDRGAAGRTHFFSNALDSQNVELVLTQSKEAGGKVERQFRTIWTCFELTLAYELGHRATLTMTEYNERLFAFCQQAAQWRHPTRRGTRASVYTASMRSPYVPARVPTADLFATAFAVETRTVDPYGQVSLAGYGKYQMPAEIEGRFVQPGMEVRLYPYPATGRVWARMVSFPHDGHVELAPAEARSPASFSGASAPLPGDVMRRASQPPKPSGQIPDVPRAGGGVRQMPVAAEPSEPTGPAFDAPAERRLSEREVRERVGRRAQSAGIPTADMMLAFAALAASEPTPAEVDAHLDHVLHQIKAA
jgi:hypothetical protein